MAEKLRTKDFYFELPDELIARDPVLPRDHCKLMVVHRNTGKIEHARFCDLGQWINEDDFLVMNDSKVIPARLYNEDKSIELLLLEETSKNHWIAIGKPGKKLKPQMRVTIAPRHPHAQPLHAEILKTLPDGERVVRFFEDFDLEDYGELAIPPYIQQQRIKHNQVALNSNDEGDYQTIYANQGASIAAPTAGLHFTPELLNQFNHGFVTLNVGLGTFRPVKVDNVIDHDMHVEKYYIPKGLREEVAKAKRVVAVGTTTVRVLESRPGLDSGWQDTRIFIYPPYKFKKVDALITNFHLPESTLIMMVAAFMGSVELQRKAYAEAIKGGYRFFSYGDAMLIL
jgi:S-adenosylmethionine:tRNA ribosyltransferase-isomerase